MSKKTNNKRINFATSKILAYPDLLEVQIKSFKDFLQLDTPPELRKNDGLYKVFSENFPIQDTRNNFTLEFGHLAIYSSPTNKHDETHEEVPSEYGGVVETVMDNNDAGPYAADKPEEFNDEASKLEKNPMDKVEFRMILSTNYLESSYVSVSNKVVEQAYDEGHAKGWPDVKIEREISKYGYDVFDVSVWKIHAHCDSEGEVMNVETNDWGNNVSQLLTVRIPYSFSPKLIGFSVWRNHTNATDAADEDERGNKRNDHTHNPGLHAEGDIEGVGN